MQLFMYGKSVLGEVRNPLEWLLLGLFAPPPLSGSASLDPRLSVSGFIRGCFLGRRFPYPPADQWALIVRRPFAQYSLGLVGLMG
jgi:hypothetical protein